MVYSSGSLPAFLVTHHGLSRKDLAMRLVGVLVGCVLLLAAGTVIADVRMIPLPAAESHLTVQEVAGGDLLITVEVGELSAMDVRTKAGTFTRLFIPGFHTSKLEGAPELPMMNRLIAVPLDATVRIEVVGSSSHLIDLAEFGVTHPVMPAQPSMPKNADPESWSGNKKPRN